MPGYIQLHRKGEPLRVHPDAVVGVRPIDIKNAQAGTRLSLRGERILRVDEPIREVRRLLKRARVPVA